LVLLAIAAAGVAAPAGATPLTPVGPVYPAPGSGTLTTTGAIGLTGGLTWAFNGVDATQFSQMVWGLEYPPDPATFSFGLNTATLAFDPTDSNLAAGTAVYSGTVEFPNLNGTTPTYPIRLTVQALGGAAMETPAAADLDVDPTVGAVIPVTGNFSANLLFAVSPDGGTTWDPADTYFNNTPHPNGSTTSSVNGAFWYTPPGASTLDFSPDPLAFGAVSVGTTSELTDTVADTGTAPLAITQINAGGDYSVPTNTCVGTSVPVGETCTITVDFTPSVTGTDNGSLQLVDNTATSPDVLDLTGAGGVAGVSFSPSPLAFGSVPIGTTSELTDTVTDTGTAPLAITQINAGGDYSAPTDTCVGVSVPVGETCTITVDFSPSFGGTDNGTLQLIDNTATSPDVLDLTGAGDVAGVSFSPNPLAFGAVPVGTTSELTDTVTDTGTAPLAITQINAGGDYSAPTDTCVGVSVPVGETCTITVDFTPSVAGTDNGTLQLIDNTATSPDVLDLTGAGGVAGISLSPSPLDFGPVSPGSSTTAGLTITNTGTAPLELTGAALSGPNASEFAVVSPGTCTAALAPSLSCQIQLSFTPAGPGTRTATLTLMDNAPPGTATGTLLGEQAATSATLSPASLDFGDVPVGKQAVPLVVTLTSSGSNPLNFTRFSLTGPNSADFSIARGSCHKAPFTLAAGLSCTIDVKFRPSVAEAETATLVATDNGGSGTQQVSLTGTGLVATDVAVYMQTSSTTAGPGGEVTFTMAVENEGSYAAPGVTLKDTLGAGLGFVSVSAPVTCSSPPPGFRGVVFCDLGALPAYTSVVVTIVATVDGPSGSTAKNSAVIKSGIIDTNPANNRASKTISIT